jgi:hypothetical protein
MQTPVQKRIEFVVTRGLGYDSRTNFRENYERWFEKFVLDDNEVKNTEKGLQAHLAHLNLKTKTLDIFREARKRGDYRRFNQLNLFDKLKIRWQLVKSSSYYTDAASVAVISSIKSRIFNNTLDYMVFANSQRYN